MKKPPGDILTLHMYALRGKKGIKAKAYMYCFYDAILLFKSIYKGGRGCLKITKFERTYFMDGPREGESESIYLFSDTPPHITMLKVSVPTLYLQHCYVGGEGGKGRGHIV